MRLPAPPGHQAVGRHTPCGRASAAILPYACRRGGCAHAAGDRRSRPASNGGRSHETAPDGGRCPCSTSLRCHARAGEGRGAPGGTVRGPPCRSHAARAVSRQALGAGPSQVSPCPCLSGLARATGLARRTGLAWTSRLGRQALLVWPSVGVPSLLRNDRRRRGARHAHHRGRSRAGPATPVSRPLLVLGGPLRGARVLGLLLTERVKG